MKLLEKLYWINSPSGNENGMSGFIRSILAEMNIDFKSDEHCQIYSLKNPKNPIICCHMDQIGDKPIEWLINDGKKITGSHNIGADDKNGLWICLNLLKKYPDLNFIFSCQEEIGGKIFEILEKNDISSLPYCLVFDRKGNSDIIGTKNNYCSKEFENDLLKIGKKYGFKSTKGIYSDCNELNYYINCVNISCGYYNAHTNDEYTVISELKNSLKFAMAIIENKQLRTKKYKLPEVPVYKYSSYTSKYYSGKSLYDEDDYYFGSDYINEPEYSEKADAYLCPKCNGILYEYASGSKQSGFICMECNYEYEEDL